MRTKELINIFASIVILSTVSQAKAIATADSLITDSAVEAQTYGSLSEAISKIGTTDKVLKVTSNLVVSSNVIIPSSVVLDIQKGAIITVTKGASLVINGFLQAGSYRIFAGDGLISFGQNSGIEPNVRWFCSGDGTDATAGFQKIVMASPDGFTIKVPNGDYLITSSVAMDEGTDYKRLSFEGEGHKSNIHGNIAAPIFTVNTLGTNPGPYGFKNLSISNSNPRGTAIKFHGFIGGSIENCLINSQYIGLDISTNTFTILVKNCVIRSMGNPTGSVGILAGGHCHILSCDIVGWDHGIRACNTTVNIEGCRLEINKTAIMAGQDALGKNHPLSRSMISGNSFEANDTAINVFSTTSCEFSAMSIQGSVNAPSAQSEYGIIVSGAYNVIFSAITPNGNYSKAAWYIDGSPTATFINCGAGNSYRKGKGSLWDIQNTGTLSGLTFINSKVDVRGMNMGELASQSSIMENIFIRSLNSYDYLNGYSAGKNMRGKNIVVHAGSQFIDVAFPLEITAGQAAIHTAVPTKGGSLEKGTYYYAATALNELGETGYTNEQRVTIGEGNNAVQIIFNGLRGVFKRRVYRGTQAGVYDGAYELPLNSNSAFIDTGAAFDIPLKKPPLPGAIAPSGAEPDPNYGVTVTPSWNTTFWISDKSTTGFRLNFGTPAGKDSRIDWLMVR